MHVALVHELETTACAFFLTFRPDGIAVGAIIRFVFDHEMTSLGLWNSTPHEGLCIGVVDDSQPLAKNMTALNAEVIPPHPRSATLRAILRFFLSHDQPPGKWVSDAASRLDTSGSTVARPEGFEPPTF